MITQEQKDLAIKLYKRKDLTLSAIANLVNCSIVKLYDIYKPLIATGELPAKRVKEVKFHKYTPTGVGKGGNNFKRKRFNDIQEQQIAKEYYEENRSLREIESKWNIHRVQMQRIRAKFGPLYPERKSQKLKVVQQLDLAGNIIKEFNSVTMASKETGISQAQISQVCLGYKYYTKAGGFKWKFK